MRRADVDALERAAAEVAVAWGVDLGPPFALARFSYVAPAGSDAVLKVTSAEDDESNEEADALALWNGKGAVRLLRHDRGRRALLIARATPGTDISALPEDEAISIAVDVGLRLWRPAAGPFRWIGDHVPRWLDDAERSGRGATDLIRVARELYASLDVGADVLVHGDFHHHNILRADDGYLAIDPKPMRGEAEFDVAPFLWNPLSDRMTLPGTERRLAVFAAAGLDERRMRIWACIRGAYLRVAEHETRVLRALL